MSLLPEPICPDCGFSVESRTHREGIGLHGHQSTTKYEANRQREMVMRKARAFSAKLERAGQAAQAAFDKAMEG